MSEQVPPHVELPVQRTESASRSIEEVRQMLRPTRSVGDLGPEVHVDVHMHPDNIEAYTELAARRAPTPQSRHHHETGVACEVAAAARLRAPVNREIHPDFEGDDGFDFLIPRPGGNGQARVEVRGTTRWDDPVRQVGTDEIDDADRFVLCRTKNPRDHVEVIGSASRLQVKYLGQTYGRDGYCLRRDYLSPLGPMRISQSEVKETLRRLHWSE